MLSGNQPPLMMSASDKGSSDYYRGRRDAMMEHAKKTRTLLRHIASECRSDTSEPLLSALIAVSGLYASIYGSQSLFFSEIAKGRLLEEVEIRFGRLMTEDERTMDPDKVELLWLTADRKN